MRLRLISLLVVIAAAVPAVALAIQTQDVYFRAVLLGKSEVPKKGPAAGKGTADILLRARDKKVCWKFTGIKGIGKPLIAHIHKGKAGVPGPVVVPLGPTFSALGCIPSPTKTTNAIKKNPGNYYVNVHTAKYEAGAIRGQLRPLKG